MNVHKHHPCLPSYSEHTLRTTNNEFALISRSLSDADVFDEQGVELLIVDSEVYYIVRRGVIPKSWVCCHMCNDRFHSACFTDRLLLQPQP